MERKRIISIWLFLFLFSAFYSYVYANDNKKQLSLFEKTEEIKGSDFVNPYQLSHWLIIKNSESVYIDGILKIKDIDYQIDYSTGRIFLKSAISPDSNIVIEYKIIPLSIGKTYQYKQVEPIPSRPEVKEPLQSEEIPSTLSISGTKTMSLSLESARGLTLNQPTRLNITGKVSENVNVTAILSDEDLPLQPEGTTEELEDLDKVLIKIEGKNLSAELGDYETSFGETEFVLFPRMLEGAQAQGEVAKGGFQLIASVTKGKSSSITLQGIEGQNEYRISLDGKYIIMVAGSESVWLNGEKMRRERDYIIRDYGDPIVEFTNNHIITSRDVIVVDYEYIEEDRNYKQNLYATRGKLKFQKGYKESFLSAEQLINDFQYKSYNLYGINIGISYATESDDTRNPIIALSDDDLRNIKNNNLDPDGDGIYLIPPEKRSILGFDGRIQLGNTTSVFGELALSKHDLNTLSIFDTAQESKAWKLNANSDIGNFRLGLSIRKLDPYFAPIGATFASRNRSIYQNNYNNIFFGELPPAKQEESGEMMYNMDLRYEPIDNIEILGSKGKMSSDNEVDHWSRTLKINLPDLPKFSNRYQSASTKKDGKNVQWKNRQFTEINYRLFKKINVKFNREEMESINKSSYAKSDSLKHEENGISIQSPDLKNISLSGEFSFETEYSGTDDNDFNVSQWNRSSSARTAAINISARPKSWLDFSGYLGHRRLSRIGTDSAKSDLDTSTNVADLKLNLPQIRLNYQIDKKLSTEKEEQYVNYIIFLADGKEQIRYLKPGEGSYVKIDEYTYREDMEKGEYIKLVRTISDRPVASVALQSVFTIKPFRRQKDITSLLDKIMKPISLFELGLRLNEEQENASSKLYLLRELQTQNTIYGFRKYWYRSQISPFWEVSLTTNWEKSNTLNKRISNRLRESAMDVRSIRIESPLSRRISIGGEWENSFSSERTSSFSSMKKINPLSDISELQNEISIFTRYRMFRRISRLEIKGTYETERDKDLLGEEEPVFTRTIKLGTEAMFSFIENGTSTIRYEIASGKSSGKLPFARYDFHEGISHKIRAEMDYRLKWFTDLILKLILRSEISEDKKPDHRIEMEATANF